jgi:hypothetical protein
VLRAAHELAAFRKCAAPFIVGQPRTARSLQLERLRVAVYRIAGGELVGEERPPDVDRIGADLLTRRSMSFDLLTGLTSISRTPGYLARVASRLARIRSNFAAPRPVRSYTLAMWL